MTPTGCLFAHERRSITDHAGISRYEYVSSAIYIVGCCTGKWAYKSDTFSLHHDAGPIGEPKIVLAVMLFIARHRPYMNCIETAL